MFLHQNVKTPKCSSGYISDRSCVNIDHFAVNRYILRCSGVAESKDVERILIGKHYGSCVV